MAKGYAGLDKDLFQKETRGWRPVLDPKTLLYAGYSCLSFDGISIPTRRPRSLDRAQVPHATFFFHYRFIHQQTPFPATKHCGKSGAKSHPAMALRLKRHVSGDIAGRAELKLAYTGSSSLIGSLLGVSFPRGALICQSF